MNTSFMSVGSVPIGFRSFADDKHVDLSINEAVPPQEVSFAENEGDYLASDSKLLQEIQNRESEGGPQEDSLEQSKLPLTAGLKQKRQAKQATKGDELYKKIMKEHGLDLTANAKANRIVYDIPHL